MAELKPEEYENVIRALRAELAEWKTMPEVRNCLTCRWCTLWSDEDRNGNRWAHCLFPMDSIPSCVTSYEKARLIDMQREFDCIGFCESPRSYIGYIRDCKAHQPKTEEGRE